MNRFLGIGRLTRDPEITISQNDNGSLAVAKYTLAIDRQQSKDDDSPSADFLSCVAFGKPAEFAEKYLRKGMKIAIAAHVQTGSYTNKDGQKVFTVNFVVENQEFVESKAVNEAFAGNSPEYATSNNAAADEDKLPFK